MLLILSPLLIQLVCQLSKTPVDMGNFTILGATPRGNKPVKKKYFAKLEQRGIVAGTYSRCFLTEYGEKLRESYTKNELGLVPVSELPTIVRSSK